VAERGPRLLAPPARIATNDLRIPAAPHLQAAAIPSASMVVKRLIAALADRRVS